MPEIEHRNQPSIPGPAKPIVATADRNPVSPTGNTHELDKKQEALNAAPAAAAPMTAAALAEAIVDSKVETSDLEKRIVEILSKRNAAAAEARKPKEPNWAALTEQEAYNPAVYIPVIEHDIPDYMDIKLKDTEYEAVWASKDQRRLGQLLAEGYEFLRPEHIASDFKAPLTFDSEKNYCYQDVIALRVHKRILFGKRRRALDVSKRQLKNTNRPPRARVKDSFELADEITLDPGTAYYDAHV